jgi:hypothetical protein
MIPKFTRQTPESVTTTRVYHSLILHLSHRLSLSGRNLRPSLHSILPIYTSCPAHFHLPRNHTCPPPSSSVTSSKRSTGFAFHTDSRESGFSHCRSARVYGKQWPWHPSAQSESLERTCKGKNIFCESAVFACGYYDACPGCISPFSLGSVLKANSLYSGAHR